MNNDTKLFGINCFNEFFSFSDFLAYTKKYFANNYYEELKAEDLLFYSKRLNLFVNKDCTVHFLHKKDPLKVICGQLKS